MKYEYYQYLKANPQVQAYKKLMMAPEKCRTCHHFRLIPDFRKHKNLGVCEADNVPVYEGDLTDTCILHKLME